MSVVAHVGGDGCKLRSFFECIAIHLSFGSLRQHDFQLNRLCCRWVSKDGLGSVGRLFIGKYKILHPLKYSSEGEILRLVWFIRHNNRFEFWSFCNLVQFCNLVDMVVRHFLR